MFTAGPRAAVPWTGLYVLLNETRQILDRSVLQDPEATKTLLLAKVTDGTLLQALNNAFGHWYIADTPQVLHVVFLLSCMYCCPITPCCVQGLRFVLCVCSRCTLWMFWVYVLYSMLYSGCTLCCVLNLDFVLHVTATSCTNNCVL
jgi:hypothetical protein